MHATLRRMKETTLKTWKKFKEEVDERLKEIGAEETVQIQYIDFSWVGKDDELIIVVDKDSEMLVIS